MTFILFGINLLYVADFEFFTSCAVFQVICFSTKNFHNLGYLFYGFFFLVCVFNSEARI